MAKKKPLKKDRKAGRGNLPAQKQPFYLQAQQQRKPKPKKQREDWDEPAIEPGEYPVSCNRMDEQGSGVVYLEGEKLPVDGLLPGEQAVVEVFGKRNLHARLLQIKKASSKRVKPQCPAFAKCGGCKMQHLQYDSQLEWKQKTVEQLMKRRGSQALSNRWDGRAVALPQQMPYQLWHERAQTDHLGHL